MKKFQFKLQRLLDFKEARENVLLTELGTAKIKCEEEKAKLYRIKSAKDLCKEKLKKQLSDGITEGILDAYRYLLYTISEESRQIDNVNKAEELRNQKTIELIEASKERKVLENLKEHRSAEYRQIVENDEQKFLDDLASFKRKGGPMDCNSVWRSK